MSPEKLKLQSAGRKKIKSLLKKKAPKITAGFFFIAVIALFIIWSPFQKKGLFVRVPIVFSETGMPCIQVEIEKNKFLFEMDSGSDSYFSIKKESLDTIKEKKCLGSSQTYDIKGNVYFSSLYSIRLIEIEKKISFKNVPAREESLDFLLAGSILIPPASEDHKKDVNLIAGRIGNHLFRTCDYWLIDLPNSVLYAIRDIGKIKKLSDFSFQDFVETELEQAESHIVIKVQTAIGEKKFALDTGANRSILRTPADYKDVNHHVLTTSQFIIGEHDFGSTKLYLFDLTDRMSQFDGLLGRDFFRKHPIYLDFKNKKAFIGPSAPSY